MAYASESSCESLGREPLRNDRIGHLRAFYEILGELEIRVGGKVCLTECSGRMKWPAMGVYFFFEKGEKRSESGKGSRAVRVGTHSLKSGSKATLWRRLSQHRGIGHTGGGNHRGSVFRLLVGAAIIAADRDSACPTWGHRSSAPKSVRLREHEMEVAVSNVIRRMPLLYVSVDDPPGPESVRGYIERNTIALLSNFERPVLDESSSSWLGRKCPRKRIRESGLWNSNHVAEDYDPDFLIVLHELTSKMSTLRS